MTMPVPVTAPRFILQTVTNSTTWAFAELTNIAMEVEPHELIYCHPDGAIQHTKQYGKTKPPTVTLKKFMDSDTSLWAWHVAAQAGSPNARLDCTLTVYKAGSPGLAPSSQDQIFQWMLQGAWPSKLDVAGMKAGGTETTMITATFQCELITIPSVSPNPTAGIPSIPANV
ncbi:MAG TPA: phage tail protein [Streptosporangiaceae bacterium]|nr:phage tail protein [Streptosporangiaceae bacterium]